MVGRALVRLLGLASLLGDLTEDELSALIAESFESWHVYPLDSNPSDA